MKGNFHLRIYLKDVFGFAEYQEAANFGLDYNLTLTRNTDNAVLNKDNAINNAEIEINAIKWYVPHYTPSLEESKKLMNQIMKKTHTELHYPEKFSLHERSEDSKNCPCMDICSFPTKH